MARGKPCISNGKLDRWPNGTAGRLVAELRAMRKPIHLGDEYRAAEELLALLRGIVNSGDADNNK